MPPGPETDAKIESLFRTQELSDEESTELHAALTAANRATRRMQIGAWHASRSVARLRLAAGAGPSGFRNSHLVVCSSEE